jgi:hypothetical protein
MGRIADHGLIEIAYLNGDPALGVRQRPEISHMAVPANPYRRPFRNFAGARLKPLVKLNRAATNIGVRGARHL